MNWISVKDKLPEKGQDAILFTKYSLYTIPTRTIIGHLGIVLSDTFYDQDGAELPIITHWMPLPEPPKP